MRTGVVGVPLVLHAMSTWPVACPMLSGLTKTLALSQPHPQQMQREMQKEMVHTSVPVHHPVFKEEKEDYFVGLGAKMRGLRFTFWFSGWCKSRQHYGGCDQGPHYTPA